MQHKKLYRTLGLIFLFFVLQGQSCELGGLISFFSYVDPTRPLDCNAFEIRELSHDASGNVLLRWVGDADEYVVNFVFQGEIIAHFVFNETYDRLGGRVSYTIDWDNLQGSDEVTIDLSERLRGERCFITRTLARPGTNPPAMTMNCADLRLTSPLGGMANGWETFYWDALDGAVNYRINIYENNESPAPLVGWDAGNVTSLSVDVSVNAIGGETPLVVELLANDATGNTCSQRYEIAREAAPVPATATPTCAENPRASYC